MKSINFLVLLIALIAFVSNDSIGQATIAPVKIVYPNGISVTAPTSLVVAGPKKDQLYFTGSKSGGFGLYRVTSASSLAEELMVDERKLTLVATIGRRNLIRRDEGLELFRYLLLAPRPSTPLPIGTELIPGSAPLDRGVLDWNVGTQGSRFVVQGVSSSTDTDPYLLDTLGTQTLLKDIAQGPNRGAFHVVSAGARTFFMDGGTSDAGPGLWQTDGTSAGTTLLRRWQGDGLWRFAPMVAAGNKIYFKAADTANNEELWVSDGSASGTKLVKEINPDPAKGSETSFVGVLGTKLLFTATDGTLGNPSGVVHSLWITDGTAQGTMKLSVCDRSGGIAIVGMQVYFARKGTNTANGALDLYQTDGTLAGTKFVTTITGLDELYSSGNSLFYLTKEVQQFKLQKFNTKTKKGTLVQLPAGGRTLGRAPGYSTAMGGWLYFTADLDGNGEALWKVQ
ncbi:MAG TPA: hypothetical protein PLB89_13180 [Flavobacteriales bacterium]|nr:hypothetical protein [Flavobacteriales bacterium]